jgi:hypothetical protein
MPSESRLMPPRVAATAGSSAAPLAMVFLEFARRGGAERDHRLLVALGQAVKPHLGPS